MGIGFRAADNAVWVDSGAFRQWSLWVTDILQGGSDEEESLSFPLSRGIVGRLWRVWGWDEDNGVCCFEWAWHETEFCSVGGAADGACIRI